MSTIACHLCLAPSVNPQNYGSCIAEKAFYMLVRLLGDVRESAEALVFSVNDDAPSCSMSLSGLKKCGFDNLPANLPKHLKMCLHEWRYPLNKVCVLRFDIDVSLPDVDVVVGRLHFDELSRLLKLEAVNIWGPMLCSKKRTKAEKKVAYAQLIQSKTDGDKEFDDSQKEKDKLRREKLDAERAEAAQPKS